MSKMTDTTPIESLLLLTLPDALLVIDHSGRIIQANTLAARLFDYPPAELTGQLFAALLPERWHQTYQRYLAECLSDSSLRGTDPAPVLDVLRRDGAELAAEILFRPLPTEKDRHFLVVIRDVSEQRGLRQALERATTELEREAQRRHEELLRINAELREREAQYRQLVENQPDLICRFLPDTRLTFVNAAYARFFDTAPDELIGKPFIDFLSPPEQAGVWEQLAAFTPAAPAHQYEHKTTRADGVHRWHLWNEFAFFDGQGKTIGFQSVGVDITDRKRAEEALFQEKERALVTLHSIGDAVITTDAHAVVDYLNPIAEALTGWSMADALGRPLEEVFRIVNEQSREPAPDPVARCLSEGKIVGLANHSILVSRTGREYHIDDSAAPIRGRDGQVLGAVLVFHDVTENRQLARQLEFDATHDALTGLTNRPEFERRLARALASAQQYGAQHALCYLDLDQFKIVNDTAGHAAGDELLRQIRTILSEMFRERDTLARIGGDEFGLLLNNCPQERAQRIAQNVVTHIRDHRFNWEGRTYQIGVSIGLVLVTAESQDTAQLLAQADIACYIAKETGRSRVHLYRREDNDTV
jgi:diguanylate cyclase (GGDEF)-like protein/PAS domain S-box-containing protein